MLKPEKQVATPSIQSQMNVKRYRQLKVKNLIHFSKDLVQSTICEHNFGELNAKS